ncbi:hypothetical protein GQ457_14G012080 [Hibiscus cannabinus]
MRVGNAGKIWKPKDSMKASTSTSIGVAPALPVVISDVVGINSAGLKPVLVDSGCRLQVLQKPIDPIVTPVAISGSESELQSVDHVVVPAVESVTVADSIIVESCANNSVGQLEVVVETANDVGILNDGTLEPIEERREQRVAAQGVARLMKGLKGKKNEHIGKRGKKGVALQVDVVCLIETRIKEDKVDNIWKRLFVGWQGVHNYSIAVNGRIWVLWKGSFQFSIGHITDQCITGFVKNGTEEFFLSTVYAWNTGSERKRLWQHFEFLHTIIGDHPWLAFGDFNVILNPDESSVPIHGSCRDIQDIRDCFQSIGLSDHAFSGPLFTWSNHQEDNPLARKLDRDIVNPAWYKRFMHSTVEVLAPGISDHCPVLVTLDRRVKSLPKPFRFFNFWSRHSIFLKVVAESWNQSVQSSNPMTTLFLKLKRLKGPLKQLNSEQYGNISLRARERADALEKLQVEFLSDSDNVGLLNRVKTATLDLQEALRDEESFYRQKSRVLWIQEGDQNTKFFHTMVAAKQNRHTIRHLRSNDGRILEDFEDIVVEAVGFYKRLIGSSNSDISGCSVDLLKELLQVSFSDEAKTELSKQVSVAEIKQAMFDQNWDKAPGPDGYTSTFFKSAWSVVGNDLINAVLYFFNTSWLHPAFNSTALVLVPKIPNPSLMKDFRPISCCSVVYKCITRIMVNRITKYLPEVIASNQSAFIKGRSILDNTLMAQEEKKAEYETSASNAGSAVNMADIDNQYMPSQSHSVHAQVEVQVDRVRQQFQQQMQREMDAKIVAVQAEAATREAVLQGKVEDMQTQLAKIMKMLDNNLPQNPPS